jgi:hypothetical protein
MVVTLEIPDDVAERMGGDLSRRALEAFVVEEHKAGRVTKAELRRLLGYSWHETEEFLKTHGVYLEMTIEDVLRDVEDMRKARF